MKPSYKEKLLSTRLQITVVIIVISSLLLAFNKISSVEWLVSVLIISLAYMINNIVSATFKGFSVEASVNGGTDQQDKK